MPRPPRRDAPGATHHVTIRGIEGRDIFLDPADRLDFLARLSRGRDESGFTCLAWSLMSNHVHLVLQTGAVPLSALMQRLNGGYALAFNRRHGRSGYLLQDRFHSSVIEDDAYRSVAVRYVLLNPVRAGIVPSVAALGSYPWTSYSELTGVYSRGIVAVAEIVAWLAPREPDVRRALEDWMEAVARVDPLPLLAVDRVERSPRRRSPCASGGCELPEVRAARHRARGWSLDALIGWVAAGRAVSEEAIRAGRRSRSESHARAVIAALASSELAVDLTSVAAATGVSLAAVSRAARRGEAIVRREGWHLPTDPPGKVKKSRNQLRPPSGRAGGG
jgi:REP element-mobilizing transposase RayT